MIFILDNFDSFTYNLFQYFGELGEEVVVRRRDKCSIEEIASLNPELIVISPGPCTPDEAQLSLEVISEFQGKLPILGVCLGHQAIGQVFGGKVIRAKQPTHGKVSLISHDGKGIFSDLPNPFQVTRYHSLALEGSSLPNELVITAQTSDGEIMGIRHKHLPIEGVQFHPEAILTQNGHQLLKNAVENARHWLKNGELSTGPSPWKVKQLSLTLPPHILFQALKDSPTPFFLDSGENYKELGDFSFIGAFPFLEATACLDHVELNWPNQACSEIISFDDHKKSLNVLDDLYSKFKLSVPSPFPFAGGAVGFFSYDLKDEIENLPQEAIDDLAIPVWRLAWYDGVIVYDHINKIYSITACGMTEAAICIPELAEERICRLEKLLFAFVSNYIENSYDEIKYQYNEEKLKFSEINITFCVTKGKYLDDLHRVIEYIYAGDIYQANLTQRFTMEYNGDPWDLYLHLHVENPAPFAAFLPYKDFQILSSSPERFIRIHNNQIETRPIKGTRPRGETPELDTKMASELEKSEKDRAELTMIIDLERNDLGRICNYGSVCVPSLIRLEKYPTVWHLVSTITGEVQTSLKPSQILKAIFPGGSITGAPKIRAMEIIEELEPYKRGIYTGSIGYLGFDGSWDLNIVIRTIILKNGTAYLNAGGGIVADSIPELEYRETLDKAKALFNVLGGHFNGES